MSKTKDLSDDEFDFDERKYSIINITQPFTSEPVTNEAAEAAKQEKIQQIDKQIKKLDKQLKDQNALRKALKPGDPDAAQIKQALKGLFTKMKKLEAENEERKDSFTTPDRSRKHHRNETEDRSGSHKRYDRG